MREKTLPIERPAAAYLALLTLARYLGGLVLLPSTQRDALIRRH